MVPLDADHSRPASDTASLIPSPPESPPVIDLSWSTSRRAASPGNARVKPSTCLADSSGVTTRPYTETMATMAGTRASIP